MEPGIGGGTSTEVGRMEVDGMEETGRTRWHVVIGYAILVAATQVLWVTYTPITTDAAAHWHVSADAVGWLSEVFPLIYVILALPFGVWADKWFRGSLAVGALLTAMGALLRIAPGYESALMGQIIISIGQPLVLNALNKMASIYAAPRHRPTVIAAGSASLFLGILLSTLTGPFLLAWAGFQGLMWIQGLFGLAACIWLCWLLRAQPEYAVEGAEPVRIRTVWRNPWVRKSSLLLFAGFGLFVTLTTWLQVLADPVGINGEVVGVGLGVMTAAGIIGSALIPEWAVQRHRARWVLCISLVASVALLVPLATGRPVWLFMVLLAVTGFLLLADLPVVFAATEARLAPNSVATATGVLLLFGNLGGIVLALAVQAMLGHRNLAIGLLALVAVATLPFAWRFPAGESTESAASVAVEGNPTVKDEGSHTMH